MAKSSPKGLGKGLGALFSETPVLETAGSGAVGSNHWPLYVVMCSGMTALPLYRTYERYAGTAAGHRTAALLPAVRLQTAGPFCEPGRLLFSPHAERLPESPAAASILRIFRKVYRRPAPARQRVRIL